MEIKQASCITIYEFFCTCGYKVSFITKPFL